MYCYFSNMMDSNNAVIIYCSNKLNNALGRILFSFQTAAFTCTSYSSIDNNISDHSWELQKYECIYMLRGQSSLYVPV